jgi:hypothetical protein
VMHQGQPHRAFRHPRLPLRQPPARAISILG